MPDLTPDPMGPLCSLPADGDDHPYSLVRTADGHLAWLSGVLPYAPDGSIVQDRDGAISAVFDVLRERLEAIGADLGDVVQTTVYLLDIDWRPALNAVFAERFTGSRPARTTVEVSRLPGGAPIEIDAVVHVVRRAG
ncbi:MAG: RidA family protein [Ilumatobacteraceae bacterium]